VQHLGYRPKEPEAGSAVLAERQRPDGAMALVACDVLHLDGRSVMREPWRDRRKRLEDLVDGRQLPRTAGEHKGCRSSAVPGMSTWSTPGGAQRIAERVHDGGRRAGGGVLAGALWRFGSSACRVSRARPRLPRPSRATIV
jgi:hypothetical protein